MLRLGRECTTGLLFVHAVDETNGQSSLCFTPTGPPQRLPQSSGTRVSSFLAQTSSTITLRQCPLGNDDASLGQPHAAAIRESTTRFRAGHVPGPNPEATAWRSRTSLCWPLNAGLVLS